jgi:putative ABC transport system ATP-binding protein
MKNARIIGAVLGPTNGAAKPPLDGGRPVLRASKLTKVYRMGEVEVLALDSVDFAAAAGEFDVILGPSGSGKSTFLNLVGGLDTATSGEAWFQDHQLTKASEGALTRYRRDHVGFVFQFYNLVPSLTALENVKLVTEISSRPMRAEEALDLVGLKDRMHHFPAQLSGGEQQRVAIARAIAKRPDLLLCDEPTGALDSKTGVVVLEALTRVNAEFGTTTLVITHNVAIRGIAHRVINFANGRIASIQTNAARIAASEISW